MKNITSRGQFSKTNQSYQAKTLESFKISFETKIILICFQSSKEEQQEALKASKDDIDVSDDDDESTFSAGSLKNVVLLYLLTKLVSM